MTPRKILIVHDTPVRSRESDRVLGQRRDRRDAARARHPLHRAQSRARATAGCTTASSTTSATARRRCCCRSTTRTRSPSRTATAKASDRMMAAALHSNVGLMHATMSIFDAWCDRAPVLILGATGPWDAAKRRPWIDWVHTCSDQGALIRDYTKWDNQPGSVGGGDGGAAARGADRADRAARPGLREPRRVAAGRARSARCRRCPT